MNVGLSYRRPWYRELVEADERPDMLEILAEHFLEETIDQKIVLDQLASRYRLSVHCLGLSVGTPSRPDREYLRRLRRLLERCGADTVSDHLAFVRSGRRHIGHLAPLPWTREAVDVVCRNVAFLQQTLGAQVLLENIAYVCPMPGEMDEAAFITRVVERSGCALLLDVANLYANARNHGLDPHAFLDGLPLPAVRQLHLAGGHQAGPVYVDSHAWPVADPVWDLYRTVLARCQPRDVVIERDDNLPTYVDIMKEVAHAKGPALAHPHPGLPGGDVGPGRRHHPLRAAVHGPA